MALATLYIAANRKPRNNRMTQYETFTNKGTREINEDRYGVAMYGNSYCFTIADGLGGHGNGEIAAQAAVDAICTMFVDEGFGSLDSESLEQAVQALAGLAESSFPYGWRRRCSSRGGYRHHPR